MFQKYCTFGFKRPALYLFDSVGHFCVMLGVNQPILVAKIIAQYDVLYKSTNCLEWEYWVLFHLENILSQSIRYLNMKGVWGLFLESPSNLTGLASCFEIKVERKVGCVLTSNEVHFVSLADNFAAPFSKLLKLPSLMESKTA